MPAKVSFCQSMPNLRDDGGSLGDAMVLFGTSDLKESYEQGELKIEQIEATLASLPADLSDDE